MFDIYVIGCGGIGGFLLQLLPQCLASTMLDVTDKISPTKKDEIIRACRLQLDPESDSLSSYILSHAAELRLPAVAESLTLIDADTFDPHNAVRQASGAGSKLAVQIAMLQQSVLFQVWLRETKLRGIDAYVTPANIAQIIPARVQLDDNSRTLTAENSDLCSQLQSSIYGYFENTLARSRFTRANAGDTRCGRIPVVFLCVDNHKTRYEVCKYLEQFASCVIINGGNSKTTGNANIYVKVDGVVFDVPIYELYPEIADPNSKRPDEVGCTEVSLHNDQISIVNNIIAAYMVVLFRKFLLGELETTRGTKVKRLNEVLIDCESCSTLPRYHNVTQ